MAHKFSVGQTVELTHRMMEHAPRGTYEIRKLMPDSDRESGNPIYRIKSVHEGHERIARESDLTRVRRT